MTTKRFLILLIVVFGMVGAQAQVFKAGVAVRTITPAQLIPISGGMGPGEMPNVTRGELYARALVLEKGSTRVAIVSIDNLGWPAWLGNRSRELIDGILPENILIGATHTHSAPDAYGFPNENGNTSADTAYLSWCVLQIADAVNEARERLEAAYLKTAVAEAKGKIAYNYYAPDLYDRRMGVIQVLAAQGRHAGKPIATLVNYATHPEILGTQARLISPDLCGPLYQQIEAGGGGTALFMNSAQGGMVTADNRRENGQEANTWEECIRIGQLMANEALRIIDAAPVQRNPQLYCTAEEIEIPVESAAMQLVLKYTPLIPENQRHATYQSISTQLNLLNVGQAQILTIPGEALPNIGFYLKRHLKTRQPFLFGLTNDAFGYFLTKEDYNSFERYNYISRTSPGEMTGEIFEAKALELIAKSPAADR